MLLHDEHVVDHMFDILDERVDLKIPSIKNQLICTNDEIDKVLKRIFKTLKCYLNNRIIPISFPDQNFYSILRGELGVFCLLNEPIDSFMVDEIIDNGDYYGSINILLYNNFEKSCDHKKIIDFLNRRKYQILSQIKQGKVQLEKVFSIALSLKKNKTLLNSYNIQWLDRSLYKEIKNTLHSITWEENPTLGLANGILGYVYYMINSNFLETINDRKIIRNTLDKIISRYLVKQNGVYLLKTGKQNNIYSPYIFDGICGLLLTLVEYEKKFNDGYYTETLSTIGVDFYKTCQGGSLYYGASGIGYTAMILFLHTQKEEYKKLVQTIVKYIPKYCLIFDGKLHTPTPYFDSFGLDISYGIGGIYFFLREVKRYGLL